MAILNKSDFADKDEETKIYSELNRDTFSHVTQTCEYSCGLACVAMLARKTIEDIKEQHFNWEPIKGLNNLTALALLAKNELVGIIQSEPFIHMLDRYYLLSVMSKNNNSYLHYVVMYVNEKGECTVYDPMKGRNEKYFNDVSELSIVSSMLVRHADEILME